MEMFYYQGLGTNEKIGLAAYSLGSDENGQPPPEQEGECVG